jgi:hypothetical protein
MRVKNKPGAFLNWKPRFDLYIFDPYIFDPYIFDPYIFDPYIFNGATWQGLITLSGVFAKPRFDPNSHNSQTGLRVECGSESLGQFPGRTGGPEMNEVVAWFLVDQVVMQ